MDSNQVSIFQVSASVFQTVASVVALFLTLALLRVTKRYTDETRRIADETREMAKETSRAAVAAEQSSQAAWRSVQIQDAVWQQSAKADLQLTITGVESAPTSPSLTTFAVKIQNVGQAAALDVTAEILDIGFCFEEPRIASSGNPVRDVGTLDANGPRLPLTISPRDCVFATFIAIEAPSELWTEWNDGVRAEWGRVQVNFRDSLATWSLTAGIRHDEIQPGRPRVMRLDQSTRSVIGPPYHIRSGPES